VEETRFNFRIGGLDGERPPYPIIAAVALVEGNQAPHEVYPKQPILLEPGAGFSSRPPDIPHFALTMERHLCYFLIDSVNAKGY
jgi:hypothetical protein